MMKMINEILESLKNKTLAGDIEWTPCWKPPTKDLSSVGYGFDCKIGRLSVVLDYNDERGFVLFVDSARFNLPKNHDIASEIGDFLCKEVTRKRDKFKLEKLQTLKIVLSEGRESC